MTPRPLEAAGLALLAAAAAACVSHADPAGRSWRELRTDRVVLVTDLDADDARERAAEFERRASALSDLYAIVAPQRRATIRPIRVVHLASCDELRRRYGEEVGGFVTPSNDFGGERIVVTCESGEALRTEVVIHELTHDLNNRYFAQLPAWLEEGLATYYQTLQLRDGKAVVGHMPVMDARFRRDVSWLPKMQKLMEMSAGELVGLGTRNGYFAAWKLTHLLANGSVEYNRRFRGMLAAYASGQEFEQAFNAAFGDIVGRLAREYGTYHMRRDLNVWQVGYRAAAVRGVLSERVLRPGEAFAVYIEVNPFFGKRTEVNAGLVDLLDRLERAEPEWPRRLYWRAVVQRIVKSGKEPPAKLLRRYLEREPDDAQAWLGLVQAELDRLVPDSHVGVEPQPPPGLEELEDEIRQLVRVSHTSAQLDTVGWYYALTRRPQIGLNFSMRALGVEPGSADAWDTLGLLYFHSGRVADAVAAARRAIALTSQNRRRSGVPPAFRARLRHYEQAARAPAS